MTLSQEMRWAYYTILLSTHMAMEPRMEGILHHGTLCTHQEQLHGRDKLEKVQR